MLEEIPTACDRGTKCNAQGYKVSWNGYKLHLDTADCGVPIAALLSSASMHDSLAAIPLSLISAERVTNLYDLMDAAYCSTELRAHSRTLNHVPLIDHNPRHGQKIEFSPAEAIRYNERSAAERSNARLKDEFGGRTLRVKGDSKVMAHLMFGVLALSADQLMRFDVQFVEDVLETVVSADLSAFPAKPSPPCWRPSSLRPSGSPDMVEIDEAVESELLLTCRHPAAPSLTAWILVFRPSPA